MFLMVRCGDNVSLVLAALTHLGSGGTAGVMAEAAAASARLAKASKKQSTLQLVKKRKAKASAAAAWASMRGDADTDTADDEVGAGGGTTTAPAGSDASAAVPGGSSTDTAKAKGGKPKAKTKKKRKAADLLASLNRSSKKRGADARKVLSNILGGKVVRRAKKKARVSRVSMPVGGSVAGKVVVSDIVKFAGKAIRCVVSGRAERGRGNSFHPAVIVHQSYQGDGCCRGTEEGPHSCRWRWRWRWCECSRRCSSCWCQSHR